MKREGFTFFEFLIYFTIFLIVVLANATWVARLWPFYMRQVQKTTTLINLYTAHDVFLRDVQGAFLDQKHLKKVTPHQLIWQKKESDIGWMIEKGSLIRQEGTYDTKTTIWHKNTKSLVVPNITHVLFQLTDSKCLIFEFACDQERVSNEIFLGKRKLLWKMTK